MVSLIPLVLALAQASPSPAQVTAALTSPQGWSALKTSKGVAVSQKQIPGIPVLAFRGTRTVDVDCNRYWLQVSNPDRHAAINTTLEESKILQRKGNTVVILQVLDLPLISHRYWIIVAENETNVGGEAGHHKQTWTLADKNQYPSTRDRVEDTYGAVYTVLNQGFWDLVPAGPDRCTITYGAVSDPGGSVPSSAGAWASEKSLPDNINVFYEAAR